LKVVLPDGRELFSDSDWYSTEAGNHFLGATDRGRFAFLWEAVYSSGSVIRQYNDVVFTRALTDDTYCPPDEGRVSVEELSKDQVVLFRLIPTALTRRLVPWFPKPIELHVDPAKGEQFVSYWLMDYRPRTNFRLCRHVIGLRIQEAKMVMVISPSGQFVLCADDNQSYEGE
jgi:hypothetical protein